MSTTDKSKTDVLDIRELIIESLAQTHPEVQTEAIMRNELCLRPTPDSQIVTVQITVGGTLSATPEQARAVHKIEQPTVHTFDSSAEAYDVSQCSDEIKNGDVLVVPSEDAIAVMIEAWPSAIDPEMSGESFHVIDSKINLAAVPSVMPDRGRFDYSESIKLAQQLKATGLADDADLDLPTDVVEPPSRGHDPIFDSMLDEIAREGDFAPVGPGPSGYAVRHVSGAYVADCLAYDDAITIASALNAEHKLVLYIEALDGGDSQTYDDALEAATAFSLMQTSYPDAYIALKIVGIPEHIDIVIAEQSSRR